MTYLFKSHYFILLVPKSIKTITSLMNMHLLHWISSINQSILFLIKRYIINALSAVQWNTHISLNTYIYIYNEIQHTYKHSYKAAISAQMQCLYFTHTHSHTRGRCERPAPSLFFGNPSLVLKSPPGVPPSMLQPRQHHSRPTLIPAARGAAFSLQVETNPDLLRDRQAG